MGNEAEEDDGICFKKKLKHLTEQLASQFAEGIELEGEIKNNLKSIGFDIQNLNMNKTLFGLALLNYNWEKNKKDIIDSY